MGKQPSGTRSAGTGQRRVRRVPRSPSGTGAAAAGVAPRALPVQSRALATRERLLGTAVEILEELGVDAFTTSLLAERAGLGIRNVYRYFPNRLAVIAALAERMADEQERSVDGFAELADPEAPWRDALARSVGSFVRALAAEPALAAVRTAMRTAPALRAIDEASDRRLAAALAAALRKRGVRRAPARLEVAGMVLMTALGAVIERTLLDESWSPEDAVRESVALAAGYLAPLMDTSAGTRRARRS